MNFVFNQSGEGNTQIGGVDKASLDKSVVIDDSTSHITICGGAGEQVKSIVKALRGLADALATLTE